MDTFLKAFSLAIAGSLEGFDRVVFKGQLPQLYAPNGMNYYLNANYVYFKDFKTHANEVTGRVLEASLVAEAKRLGRYEYIRSGTVNKEKVALQFAAKHKIEAGLVCVLQALEPCWTFDTTKNAKGFLTVRGEPGKCSHLYHYYIHPKFGWMYIRLQTWFPFEIQVGINGREWLARQMDQEGLAYVRSDNKFLQIADWQRAQQLMDKQLCTNWVKELDALQKQVHPAHPGHLGRMPIAYNWTVFQSEWATDLAFHSQQELESWSDRWLRQAFLTYDTVDVLRFLGRTGQIHKNGELDVQSNVRDHDEGRRIKHYVQNNSVKLYTCFNIARMETTINNPARIQVLRPAANKPRGRKSMRPLRRSVADMRLRVEMCKQTNNRYLEAVATIKETRTVKELAESLTAQVAAPRSHKSANPMAEPSNQESANPMVEPSNQKSTNPMVEPSNQKSTNPMVEPSNQKSTNPMVEPSNQKSTNPMVEPSNQKSTTPVAKPTSQKSAKRKAQATCQECAKKIAKAKSHKSATIRKMRGLNPLASGDAALLSLISDPKWIIHGLRNRDVVASKYKEVATELKERRRRTAQATRLLRLLRGHGLIEKVAGTHSYQMTSEGRIKVQAVLAACNANPDELTSKAA